MPAFITHLLNEKSDGGRIGEAIERIGSWRWYTRLTCTTGCSLGEHHFGPGFPQMAWPMTEWVLDTRYRDRFDSQKRGEASILVFEAGESQLIPAMKAVEAAFPAIKVFSLPSMGQDGSRIHVELGVRGTPSEVGPAMELLRRTVGFPYQ